MNQLKKYAMADELLKECRAALDNLQQLDAALNGEDLADGATLTQESINRLTAVIQKAERPTYKGARHTIHKTTEAMIDLLGDMRHEYGVIMDQWPEDLLDARVLLHKVHQHTKQAAIIEEQES